MGATDINECEQTPQGLSDQMFTGESFETWSVYMRSLAVSLTYRGQTYQINTASYHFTTFAFLPLLAAATDVGGFSEPGNVINLSSISGMTITSQRGQFNYNASKAATIALSKMQATEFARRNLKIRVNCICPGYFPSVSRECMLC
jgi:NAD(P)-dependent dehydrogenase (short-subunit alcohol dehydrogenase family)